MDFAKFDTATLARGKQGNLKPLIDKIRNGGWITDDERQFIADRLEGKRSLKRGPKPKLQTKDLEVYHAYLWLTLVSEWAVDAAKERIAEIICETSKSVRTRLHRAQSLRKVMQFSDECTVKLEIRIAIAKIAGVSSDEYIHELLRNWKLKK